MVLSLFLHVCNCMQTCGCLVIYFVYVRACLRVFNIRFLESLLESFMPSPFRNGPSWVIVFEIVMEICFIMCKKDHTISFSSSSESLGV